MTIPDTAILDSLFNVYRFNWLMESGRYIIGVLLIWGLLHVLLRKRLAHRLIDRWPSARDMRREFIYSFSSLCIFSAIGVGIFALILMDHAHIYRQPGRYGLWWFWLSLPVMIIWHDTYFYWTHRLLHTRWLFRHVHGVHHRSRQPSPWAAYAFHPLEAIVNGLVTAIPLMLVPLHGLVLFLFGVHQILRNAHGHAAVEIMPRGFARHWFWGRFTTTTHHHLHHEYANGNYGLWFTGWDRLMGTERADYHERFSRATAPRVSLPADQ